MINHERRTSRQRQCQPHTIRRRVGPKTRAQANSRQPRARTPGSRRQPARPSKQDNVCTVTVLLGQPLSTTPSPPMRSAAVAVTRPATMRLQSMNHVRRGEDRRRGARPGETGSCQTQTQRREQRAAQSSSTQRNSQQHAANGVGEQTALQKSSSPAQVSMTRVCELARTLASVTSCDSVSARRNMVLAACFT